MVNTPASGIKADPLEAAAGVGRYEWRPAEDRLEWSDGLLLIYGRTEAPRCEKDFGGLLHPDDRVRVEAETSGFLSSRATTYSHAFRIVRPDGAVRHIIDRGVIERDSKGRAVLINGINVDVSDLPQIRRSEENERMGAELAQFEALFAEAPLGLALLDTELRFVRINQALAEINGFTVQEHLGRSVWDLLPALRDSAQDALRRVLESGVPLRNVAVKGETPARPGELREWCEHFYPVRAGDGAIIGIGIVCEEVTERVAAERAMLESEARFRNMADNAPVMVWVTDKRGYCTYLSRSWYDFTGQTPETALGFGWLDAVHPDDAADSERIFLEASKERRAFQLEYRLRRVDGTYSWAIDSARPRVGDRGEFLGFIGSVIDIAERKASEEALRAARDTFRQLVDRSPFGVYAVDSSFRLVQVSDGAQKVFERIRPLIGRDFADVLRALWPEPFASEAIGHFRETLSTGQPYHSPKTVERRADIDVVESYDWKIERITLPDGRFGVVCHFYDLSERQAHEDKIRDVMREVNHRVKNLLALVDAIARQTASVGGTDFLERFTSRLRALAAGQDLLLQTDWEGADLSALVETQLLHFKDLFGARITIDGPRLLVSSQSAQTLGMALHELATNAAKYGALSNDTGQVAVAWRVDGEPTPQFTMTWTERDGPHVVAPERTGFGDRVVRTMVQASLMAEVALDYAPEGVRWNLSCSLAALALEPNSAGTPPRAVP